MSDKKNSKLNRQERRLEKKKLKALDKARIAEEKRQDRDNRFMYEDPVGFMRVINIISVVLLIFAFFFGTKYIINGIFLLNYNAGKYSYRTEEFLQKINIPEGYVPYYNAGNAYYMLEDYDNAILSYKSALESHPTEKKECDIRVNLALAMLHKVDFDNINTEKQKANAIRQLQSARNVLTEKGCADPYGTNGHDPEAEQLKQDIDKMLEELDAEPEPPNSEDEQEQQQSGGGSKEKEKTKREEQLEKDLNNQKQDAMEEQQQTQTSQDQKNDKEQSGGGSGSNYDGKTW